jgi:hypothetical protein
MVIFYFIVNENGALVYRINKRVRAGAKSGGVEALAGWGQPLTG